MPGKHAKLSASSAHRWLVCTAAPTIEAQFPDTTSEYAAEGSRAHYLAELSARYALKDITLAEYKRRLNAEPGDDWPEEMADAAQAYSNLIRARRKEALKRCPDPLVVLEQRVDFSDWVPHGFGTADCMIIADGTMEVIDFKYGKNVKVEADDNPQMMLYALGAYAEYSDVYRIDTVRVTVFQPRMSDESSVREMPTDDLLAWAENVLKPIAREAYDGPGEFHPGEDVCLFCRAKAECKAKNASLLALLDDEDDVEPALLSPGELGDILRKAAGMEKWLKEVKERAQAMLLSGKPVPGWKMVEGRSDRVIKEPTQAAAKLIKVGCNESLVWQPRKLETLTNLTKLVKPLGLTLEGALGDLIEKPEGKPTLVPDSDKREPFQPGQQLLTALDE